MSCTNCTNTIQTALSALEGVRSVRLSLVDDSATVEWDEPPMTLQSLAETVEELGFHVKTMSEKVEGEYIGDGNGVQTFSFAIQGMTCSMCSQAITRAVEALEGVDSIQVSLSTDSAVVSFRRSQVDVETIKAVIEDVGYEVAEVTEMRSHVPEDAAQSAGDPIETVVEQWQRIAERQEEKVRQRRQAFLWSMVGAFPILFLSMILPRFVSVHFLSQDVKLAGRSFPLSGLLFWLLATPVQFISGWDFYRMTFFNLRVGTAGMDVLVSLGTTASYGYACWGLWKDDHESTHFFETSATLICFVLAGKWMQAMAVRRTSKALTELMKLQTQTAIKVSPSDKTAQSDSPFNPLNDPYIEETVPINDVRQGNLVKVIRGSSIPADGRIAYGEMSVDESMVTGESMPVLKMPGSDVLGGTICVETGREGSGAVFVEVTGVGSDTALAQIIQLVQDAQTRAVPIQSFADSVSAIFVPTVCTLSLLTYMTWYALCSSNVVPVAWYEDLQESPATFSLTFAIACLVISCPCALGLATPTAVMVGTGVGARLGVLMKGGEALEVASKVDSVVLDKTGTLTKGVPRVVDYKQFDRSIDSNTLLWMLGSLEQNSEHPLANAVVTYAQDKLGVEYLKQTPLAQPKSFTAHTGRGAKGTLVNSTIAVGNRLFAAESGIEIPDHIENYMQLLEGEGKTSVVISVNARVCSVMGIADRLKSDAIASVTFLRDSLKLDVWMVTGDTRATAAAIGRQLGLPEDRIISEALPAAKVEQVLKLQGEDHIVAMVGDGINDSPALAQADVGISLGSGAKIATEASDMVLVRGNMADVCTALHLSRVIFRRLQLNLLFSLIYNCLGIPIAAGAFYPLYQQRLPPTLAGAAMALSSVSVVLSSLSLRLYRCPPVFRRQSFVTAWAREIERQRDSMEESLVLNDHLGYSDFTEVTEVVDNRTPPNAPENAV